MAPRVAGLLPNQDHGKGAQPSHDAPPFPANVTIFRELEYHGRLFYVAVLPQRGRWAYRIEDGPVRMLQAARGANLGELLLRQAQAAAWAEIDLDALGSPSRTC